MTGHQETDAAFWAILLGVLAVGLIVGVLGIVATVWSVMDVVHRKRPRTPLWIVGLVLLWPYFGLGYWLVMRKRPR